MAPELRKKKSQSKLREDAATNKPTKAVKRKAAADDSPVASKKKKSTRSVPAGKSVAKKEKAAAGGAGKREPKEKTITPTADDGADAFEGFEEDDETRALVRTLDSGSEDETNGTDVFVRGQDVGRIPDTTGQKAAKDSPKDGRGVIYLGSIPHGFYEHEMRQYFSQFGAITNLRLSRNKKTGASKHYAFIEFAEESTAEIAAKTMDAYLLFGHILRCKLVPKLQQHENLFKGANRRFSKVPWNKMEGRKLERPRTETAWGKRVEKEEERRASRAEKLKALGYEYDVPKMAAPVAEAREPEAAGTIEDGAGAAEGDKAPAAGEVANGEPDSHVVGKTKAPRKPKGKKAAKGKKVEA